MPNQPDFSALEQRVIGWADGQGILHRRAPTTQAAMQRQTATDLQAALEDNDYLGIKGAIGESLMGLIIQARMEGASIAECLDYSYQEIASRGVPMADQGAR